MDSMKEQLATFNGTAVTTLFSPATFKNRLKELLQHFSNFGILIDVKIQNPRTLYRQKSTGVIYETLLEEGTIPLGEEADDRKTETLQPSNCKCILSYKLREDLKSQRHILETFDKELMPLLWKAIEQTYGQRIDASIFIPRIDEVEKRNIERAIQNARADFPVSFVAIDLDDFKRFNDPGRDTGDEAIRLFGSLLSKILQRYEDVYFYRSHAKGDEFILLFCGKSTPDVLRILMDVQVAVSELHIEKIDVPFSASCGLAVFPEDEQLPVFDLDIESNVGGTWLGSEVEVTKRSFDHYYFLADQAENMKHGKLENGSRFPTGGIYRYKYFATRRHGSYKLNVQDLIVATDEIPLLLADCRGFSFFRSRSSLNDSDVNFEYIVQKLFRATHECQLWTFFMEALIQLNITFCNSSQESWVKVLEDGKTTWPQACVLFVSSFNYALFYNEDFRKRFHNVALKASLWYLDSDRERLAMTLEIGGSKLSFKCPIGLEEDLEKLESRAKVDLALYMPADSIGVGGISKFDVHATNLPRSGDIRISNVLSPVLVLCIGTAFGVPKKLETLPSAICFLDDRPTMGGGLPDAWQSNISKIVNYVASNPNVLFLVFFGNSENASETWKICTDIKKLEGSLQRCETFIDRKLLERFAKQIREVITCSNTDELRRSLPLFLVPLVVQQEFASIAQNNAHIDEGCGGEKPIQPDPDQEQERIFTRDIALQNYQLKPLEGLTFENLNSAYPAVIDLLRNTHQEVLYEDQIKRQMRELKAFKLVLTKPVPPAIPLFFTNTKSAHEFEEYYFRVFDESKGLFGKRIFRYPSKTGEAFNQYERQLNYVCEQIKNTVDTRRAGIQIAAPSVDWAANAKQELPLGLINISILPRRTKDKGRWRMHYCFNWRTVEAIVGFPFSAYASCRFAEDFTKRVQNQLGRDFSIEIGEVVYYAISLHMFEDRFERTVARKIVEQVTK